MTDRNGKPTVMIVDDEEMVTISLKNLFRLHADYTLVTYTSPACPTTIKIPSERQSKFPL